MEPICQLCSDLRYHERWEGLFVLQEGKRDCPALKHLVSECSTASPFDYQNHTRMYIPEDMPAPDNKSDDYINAITESILRLIDATNGHTAILFTSYKVLQAVYERAIHQLGKYEVFCMTRNNRKVISDFRKSRNGVLFASGSMWEGVDCVGDGLSSVIIVRLPFL